MKCGKYLKTQSYTEKYEYENSTKNKINNLDYFSINGELNKIRQQKAIVDGEWKYNNPTNEIIAKNINTFPVPNFWIIILETKDIKIV